MNALAWPLTVLLLGFAVLLAFMHAWAAWLEHRDNAFLDEDSRGELEELLEESSTKQAEQLTSLTERVVQLENSRSFQR